MRAGVGEDMRLGLKIPSGRPLPAGWTAASMARAAEDAGLHSVWCSDHVVMPEVLTSEHPGRRKVPDWDTTAPWPDALVTMSFIAGATASIEVGVSVLVVPLREPVQLAKQIATLDSLSGGRVAIGVGAGWLAEEFRALGVPFTTRGQILDRSIAILRDCWTGSVEYAAESASEMPQRYYVKPTPLREVPLLVGGMSLAARTRAARVGDGWMPVLDSRHLDRTALRALVTGVRTQAAALGRDGDELRVLGRVGVGSFQENCSRHLALLSAAGFDDMILDVAWGEPKEVSRSLEHARALAEPI